MFLKVLGHSTRVLGRLLVFLLVLAAFTAISATYVIQKMFTPEHITAIVTDQLQQLFGRPVLVDSVNVLVFSGIKIRGVRILDNTNSRGQDFLSTGPITIRYDWRRLLDKRVVINEVDVDSLHLNLSKNKDGGWNVPVLKTSGGLKDSRFLGLSVEMALERLHFSGAQISIINEAENKRRVFYETELSFSNFSLESDFQFTAAWRMKESLGAKVYDIACETDGVMNTANMNWDMASIKSVNVRLRTADKIAYLEGSLSNFIHPRATMRVDLPALLPADLVMFGRMPQKLTIPGSRWQLEVADNGSGGWDFRSVTARAGQYHISGDGYISVSSGTPVYAFSLASGQFNLKQAAKTLPLLSKYSADGLCALSTSFGDDGHGFAFKKLEARGSGLDFSLGEFRFSDVDITASFGPGLREYDLALSKGSLTVRKQVFAGISGTGSYHAGTLVVKNFAGSMNGLPFRVSMTARDAVKPGRKIELYASFHSLRLPDFFSSVGDIATGVSNSLDHHSAPVRLEKDCELSWLHNFCALQPGFMPNIKGALMVQSLNSAVLSGKNLRMDFDLKSLQPGMKKLSGRIEADMGPGTIYQLEKMAETNKALNVAFRPFLTMHKMQRSGEWSAGSVLKDVPYRRMAGSFDFKDGDMHAANFFVDGSSMTAAVSGLVGWVSEKMDLNVATMFNTVSRFGGLPESMTDASGKPALLFNVKGTMTKAETTLASPKGTGRVIEDAARRGVRTDFGKLKSFIRGGK